MRKLLLVVSVAAAFLFAGCDENTGVSTGVLVVFRVQTTGANLDPDGYFITLNSEIIGSVATNGQQVFGLGEAMWSLGLEDVAANCVVQGDNPRDVEVALPQVLVEFQVVCS